MKCYIFHDRVRANISEFWKDFQIKIVFYLMLYSLFTFLLILNGLIYLMKVLNKMEMELSNSVIKKKTKTEKYVYPKTV